MHQQHQQHQQQQQHWQQPNPPQQMTVIHPPVAAAPDCCNNMNIIPRITGIILIICGGGSLTFNIVDVAVNYSPIFLGATVNPIGGYTVFKTTGFVGHGFWSGAVCIIAGGMQLAANTSCKTRSFSFASLILLIVAAALSTLQFAVAVIGAWWGAFNMNDTYRNCVFSSGSTGYNYNYYNTYTAECEKIKALIAMESMLAIFGLVGTVVAIVGAAFNCRSAGCCTDNAINGGVYDN